MTGSRLYLDTAPFIYFLEKSSLYFDQIRGFFIACKNQRVPLVTSAITIEEYCVFPLSQNDKQLWQSQEIPVFTMDNLTELVLTEN